MPLPDFSSQMTTFVHSSGQERGLSSSAIVAVAVCAIVGILILVLTACLLGHRRKARHGLSLYSSPIYHRRFTPSTDQQRPPISNSGAITIAPTHNNFGNATMFRPPGRGAEAQPPPAYGNHGTGELISAANTPYDPPHAFETAARIALSAQHNGKSSARATVVSATMSASSTPNSLTLLERMEKIQRLIDELNTLTKAVPATGYAPHSLESQKMVQIRESIALLREQGGDADWIRPPEHPPSLSLLESSAIGPGPLAGGSHPPTRGGTLHERLLEIQQLLAEVDGITSGPRNAVGDTEVRDRLQALRDRVALLMEVPEAGSGPPPFPPPVHPPGRGRPIDM